MNVVTDQRHASGRLGEVVRQLADAALEGEVADLLWQRAAQGTLVMFRSDAAVGIERVGSFRMIVRTAPGASQLVTADPVPFAPDSQAAFVLHSEQPVVVSNLLEEARFTAGTMMVSQGFRSSVSCRVGRSADTIGFLGAFSREVSAFSERDAASLQVVAAALNVGLVHHRRTRDLETRATTDALTGIANRASILADLEEEVGKGERRALHHVLMIDLDGFKQVNDRWGHEAGDHVLRIAAQRITAVVGNESRVGRLGGDEFLVLLRDPTPLAARRTAERIVGHLEEHMAVPGSSVSISASVGIAAIAGALSAADCLKQADGGMYAAKAAGRGRVRVAAPVRVDRRVTAPTDADAASSAVDLAAVDEAIASLDLLMQPVVELESHRTAGFSASARGPVGSALREPEQLFSTAETFGRLVALDVEAKRVAFACPTADDAILFVKIAPPVFANEEAMAQIEQAWLASPARNRQVMVELSVRSLSGGVGNLLRAIGRARDLGWGIALDDFGHRTDSLTSLRVIKPEVVKLDMTLVRPEGRRLVGPTMVGLAEYRRNGGTTIVAKGIETDEHVDIARLLGAELLQGYRFRADATTNARGSIVPFPRGRRRSGHAEQVATKQQLVNLSRFIETSSTSADSMVLACLQRIENYTPRTRRQYAALARRSALVGVVGAGLGTGIVNGVRHGDAPADSSLARQWEVVALSSGFCVALLAEQIDDHPELVGPTPSHELFRFRLTTDPLDVERAAERLLHLL